MVRSLFIGLGLLGLTAAGLGDAGQLFAQTAKPGEPRVLRAGDRIDQSKFRLFGDRDFAYGGFRLTGGFTACNSNEGDLTTSQQCFDPTNIPYNLDGTPNWFNMFFYVAAPPSEWLEHQAAVPSLANAVGKGYTVNTGNDLALTGEFLPKDGTLGPLHSGAQSTTDGSCFDISQDLGPFTSPLAGQPMLAASDCDPTWGSAGWGGSYNVDQDGYLGYANLVGSSNFTFDSWRVPEGLQRTDKFLGSHQTFGYYIDYSSEALYGSGVHPSYGSVIPENSPISPGGDPAEVPTRTGWPLGIEVKQDAFSFASPGMTNTAWYHLTITNKSRELYGVGLDYDSLYMGLLAGWLQFGQGSSVYRDPANGVVRGATFGQTPGCGPFQDPQHPCDQWGTIGGVGEGFWYGAGAIIVMKSPIGDLRNKKFNDPASPFYQMGDMNLWDDTITFNHGHMCGYHSCSATTNENAPSFAVDDDHEQRQFGMVASIPSDVLGNRSVNDPDDHTMWDTFRWEEYPDRNSLDFNRWTPGGWDYDGDALDDLLSFDDCTDNATPVLDPYTGNRKNCSVSWSDSLPGGFGNLYSNESGVVGAGPFPLGADSTVQFVIAVISADDGSGTNVAIENDINVAIDHYMNFYLGPEPAPSPNITSVDINAGGGNVGGNGEPQAEVTLYWDDTAEEWIDPFLSKFLVDLQTAGVDTELGKIRELNPFLADTLVALIPNNVALIHVFKSCDSGGTFTDDQDCFADPASGDGFFAALGWLPWASLSDNGGDGDFPNTITDNGIFGGRQFLYSLVTETRGLTVSVQTGDVLDTLPSNEVICIEGCGSRILTVAPRLAPTIGTSTTLGWVVNPYVPISDQPGAEAPSIAVITGSPDFIPFERMGVAATQTEVDDGNYDMMFGSEVIVTEWATLGATAAVIDSTMVQVIDGGTDTVTLKADGEVGVEGDFQQSIAGDQRERVWAFGFAAVLATESGTPLTVTDDLTGGQTVPGRYFGISNYPGFTFSIDNGLSRGFSGQVYLDADENEIQPLVVPSVTFLDGEVSGLNTEGRYRITWADQAYGQTSPFVLDFTNPDGTRDAVVASLEARALGQTASQDPNIAAKLGLPVEALLPIRLPFEIENITDIDNPTPVEVVMTGARKITEILLGDGLDTLLVTVPETEWVPGDVLTLVEGTDYSVTFAEANIGCFPPTWRRLTCNPVALGSRGATGYIPNGGGMTLSYGYYQTITEATGYTFSVTSAVTGDDLMAADPDAIRDGLADVKVVPNPFVMFSPYSTSGDQDRIIFTHVPPQGVVRMFTVAGQFVQEVRWTPADVNERGDLFFNLRSKEGLEMAAGLYLYVLTALDDNGNEIGTAKGKFVLIR